MTKNQNCQNPTKFAQLDGIKYQPAMTMKMIGAESDKSWWIKFWLLFLNQIFCIVKLNLPERIFSKNRCGVSVAHCWLLTLSNSQQLQMILLMLDVNDLSWQIILAVTWVQPTGRYINEVSDAKFTQYNHPSSLLDNFFVLSCEVLCHFVWHLLNFCFRIIRILDSYEKSFERCGYSWHIWW